MSRLPTPGGDNNIWGDLLNDYLSVEHNPDGTLKKSSLISGAQQVSAKGQPSGYASLDSVGKVPSSQLPPATASSPTLVVVASDASSHSKAAADYSCDGTDDQTEINAAIAALPTNGGKVVLSEGTFNIASSILIQNDNVTMVGSGAGQRSGTTQSGVGTKLLAQVGIATAIVLVQRAANDRPVYGALLRDFTVDGALQGTAVDERAARIRIRSG